MASANTLKQRLFGFYDESPVPRVMPPLPAGQAWPAGAPAFGGRIDDVMTIVIHETSGFPARNRAGEFVGRYVQPTHELRGFGPQFYLSSDGTAARLIDQPLLTWHATFLNRQTLGIENGHRNDRRGANGVENWNPLSADAEDVPGQKFFTFRHRFDNPTEVLFCWFPTAEFSGPKGSPAVEPGMLFTEANYRSLAALARYLAELVLVPRNFPLLPWATREDNLDNPPAAGASPPLRLIALADEKFSPFVAELAALGFTEPMFDRANLVAFRTHYSNAIIAQNSIPAIPQFGLNNNNKRLNSAWLQLFKVFRGFHGHGFAGSAHFNFDDHTTCPGPLFDWYRFAREVWDWWWYPFDFDDAFTTTGVSLRGYRSAGPDTPLLEYFFENTPNDERPDPYFARSTPPNGPPGGIIGPASSPSTFRLDPGTPIYAMANGELVAARLLPPGAGVSMSFILVRHEVYHLFDPTGTAALLAKLLPGIPPPAGRLDYDAEPATVYSLYMHLGQTDQMSFDEVVPNNPDWLNRALIHKKECDLAIDNKGNLNAVLQTIPPGDFSRPPPTAANRPTSIELFRMDKLQLAAFIDELRRGDVAIPPRRRPYLDDFGPTPINVLLGDFLGTAGTIRVVDGVPTDGICVEVFSPQLINPFFTEVKDKTRWDPPPGVAHPAIPYASEWARAPTVWDLAAMGSIGINPDLVSWWADAVRGQLWDVRVPAGAVLRLDGNVYHYPPLDFIRWINKITWASEWPKYRMTDAAGDIPRPRRIV